MPTKLFNKEDVEECRYANCPLVQDFESKWSQDSKMQYQTIVFHEKEIPGIFWEVEICRSGSPFTDWNYEWGENSDNMITAEQVEKREVIKIEWVAV